MGELHIALPEPGAKRHPTKIALFSTEDIPRGERNPLVDLFEIPAVIAINGEVMEFTVSEFVGKGQVIVLDRAILEHDRWAINATEGVAGLIAEINQIEVNHG